MRVRKMDQERPTIPQPSPGERAYLDACVLEDEARTRRDAARDELRDAEIELQQATARVATLSRHA